MNDRSWTPLDPRFMAIEHRSAESRVIGAYLNPRVKFTDLSDINTAPGHLAQVVHTFDVGDMRLMVCRMGGVFVSPPATLVPFWERGGFGPSDQYEEKVEFQRHFAEAANLLVAELAMCGIPLDPLSPLAISSGQTFGGQAILLGGSGTIGMRDLEVGLALHQPPSAFWINTGINVPDASFPAISALRRAQKLHAVSPTLPTFIAAAYAFMRDGQQGEALMDAWIVAEQLIHLLWSDWVRSTSAAADVRKELGRDRIVRRKVNMLEACGVLKPDVAAKVRVAANHRNQVVHRSAVEPGAADAVFDAMLLLVARQLDGLGVSGATHRAGGISW
jgi:hypothetical protein